MRVLLGEAPGRDRLQAREEPLIAGVLARKRREGVFVQAVVIAIVAVGRRPFRVGLKFGLVVFLKEHVLSRRSRLDGGGCAVEGRAVGGGDTARDEQNDE
jgi:hypothetical protein